MHFIKSTIPKEVVNEICILFIKKFERRKKMCRDRADLLLMLGILSKLGRRFCEINKTRSDEKNQRFVVHHKILSILSVLVKI